MTTRLPERAPPTPRPARRAATPIYVSERVRSLLVLALLGALLVLVWAAPSGLVALGAGSLLAVLFSVPVTWLARGLPRGLAAIALRIVKFVS